jgi:2-polyprenyl-6-methoxyphenol hydroxylase-like FAD-dependent oxidoreductase
MGLLNVAIIGAGAGGLTLAVILQNHQIPFTVFELDSSPLSRNQGGTLDLHPDGGQLALREAGLWDQFAKHARPESDVLKIVNLDGTVLWDGNGNDKREIQAGKEFDGRPEIDRGALRKILLAALEPGRLKWGKKLSEVAEIGSETFELHFADGTVEGDFNLVVGAEGAWSKVRQLLTDTQPFYSGITTVELWAADVQEKSKWMCDYVGAGNLFCFGEGRAIQSQRIGDGSIRTYASLRKPETFAKDCGIDWTKPEVARKELVETYYADCGEDLKRIILESSEGLIPRPLYAFPVGFQWDSKPGVTLLGDAAHLMTPFAGIGVNAAMVDALELGRAIIAYAKSPEEKSLAAAIAGYEAEMFPRNERYAQRTLNNLNAHFSAGGSEHMVKRIKAAHALLS